MKPIATIILSTILTSSVWLSCSSSDPEPEPQFPVTVMEPVIFNFTGTWDSECGTLSRSVMDSLRLIYPQTSVINVHINGDGGVPTDPLSSSESEALARFFNVFPHGDSTYHIPYTWFMCPGVVGGFNFSTNAYHDLSISIDWTKTNLDPALALDILPEVTGNQLTVKIKTEAVQNFPVPVFLSVYLTEDELIANQVDDEGLVNGIHHDVFRHCLNEFNGDKIANSIGYSTQSEYTYSTVLDNAWKKENMKITVVVWYKDEVYGNLVHLGKRVDLLP